MRRSTNDDDGDDGDGDYGCDCCDGCDGCDVDGCVAAAIIDAAACALER